MVRYICNPKQPPSPHRSILPRSSVSPQIKVSVGQHSAVLAQHHLYGKTPTPQQKNKNNHQKAEPSHGSWDPHWAGYRPLPQHKPQLGFAQGQAQQLCWENLQLLLQRHLVWVTVIFQELFPPAV